MNMFAATFDRSSALAPFRDWQSEQESLDAQLSESLDALAAYQSQLDSWQLQLAAERDELRLTREQIELDLANAETFQAQPSLEVIAELDACRDKITTLTTSLLARTEELRTLDNRHGELVNELERARASEQDLKTTFEEFKRMAKQEVAERNEELCQLRNLLERRGEVLDTDRQLGNRSQKSTSDCAAMTSVPASNNPVLGSIVEQFGKLRQQRATDRQAFRKAR